MVFIMNFLDTTRPCIKHNPHHALTRGLEVVKRHVKYTPPTVCDDLMAQIGAQVDLARHNKALEAHKKKYTEILEFIAIDDVDDEYDNYLDVVNDVYADDLLMAGGVRPSVDAVDAMYDDLGESIEYSWAWHCMKVRWQNGLLVDEVWGADFEVDDDIVQIS